MNSRDDPEHVRAVQWIKTKEIIVPSVVHNGEIIYQIKHVPVRAPERPEKYDRVNGLGYFHVFKYVWLREFLDDRLNIATVCKLASTSKEFAVYASDEKYVLNVGNIAFTTGDPFWIKFLPHLRLPHYFFHFSGLSTYFVAACNALHPVASAASFQIALLALLLTPFCLQS
jgi:hypothetical protein